MPELIIKKCSKCGRKAVAFDDDFMKNNIKRISFMDGSKSFCEGGCSFDGSFSFLTSIMATEGFMAGDSILDSVSDLQEISDYETEKEAMINEGNAINRSYQDVNTEYSSSTDGDPFGNIFSESQE